MPKLTAIEHGEFLPRIPSTPNQKLAAACFVIHGGLFVACPLLIVSVTFGKRFRYNAYRCNRQSILQTVMNVSQPLPDKIFPLRTVTRRLKELLLDVESKRFWVQAQYVPDGSGRLEAGHCYCSLIDNDDSGKAVARMKAVIWRADRERIEQKLKQAGCEQLLSEGQEICALCAVRFHPVYGLSLEISDVDPTAGESLLEKNRRDVLERLKSANLLDLNKQLSFPAAPLRIGLITAPGSAAYADFTQTLLFSGFAFRVHLVQAAMQGETTQAQVVAAIRLLERREIDVICLVRGGGSSLDLASFDRDGIGQAIANCQKPVWVGIGHEIDVTVPDFVAHARHKTPTAVATALVQRIQDLDTRLQTNRERFQDVCERQLKLADRQLDRSSSGMRQGLRKHLELHQTRFAALGDRLVATVRQRFNGEYISLDNYQVRLQDRARRLLAAKSQELVQAQVTMSRGTAARLTAAGKDADQRINRLRQANRLVNQQLSTLIERERFLDAVRPERMLARGYSVTRDVAGNLIRDAGQVRAGQLIHTQLAHGTLTSTVGQTTEDSTNAGRSSNGNVVRGEGTATRGDSGAIGSLGDSDGRIGQ